MNAEQNLFQFEVEQEPINQSRPSIVIYKFCIKGKKIISKQEKSISMNKVQKKPFNRLETLF